MTQVLLVTDTERVQRVFESLEGKGLLQLRTAATLVKGDEEISAAAPDYVFLQSRVSGFSGEIAARHLQKSLPKHTKVILLAVDDEDAAQAKRHGKPFLSLALEDQVLGDAVADVVQGKPVSKKASPVRSAAATKGKAARGKEAEPEAAVADEEPAAVAPPQEEETEPAAELPALPVKQLPAEAAAPPPAVPTAAPKPRNVKGKAVAWLPPSIGEEPEPESTELPPPPSVEVEEFIELSAALPEPRREFPAESAKQLEREEPAATGGETAAAKGGETRSFSELIDRASAQEPSSVPEPPESEEWYSFGSPAPSLEEEPESASDHSAAAIAARLHAAEYLASVHRREKKHKRWVIPVAVALVFIPLIYFIAISQPIRKAILSVVPAHPPVAAHKPPPPARPVAAAPAAKGGGAARPALPPSAPVAPAPASTAPTTMGLKTLPPFLAGVDADPGYSKAHPGWQRFLGARAEYRVFKQGELYRAIQVLAQRRQSIPEDLFKRVLLEFGGADGYLLESREKKGPYLIERGETKGNLALTIYRNNKDLAVKGLVLYYR
jgi:CheY-like chemotaxis protein